MANHPWQPAARLDLGTTVPFSVARFEGRNWSLADLYPGYPSEQAELAEQLARAAHEMGCWRLYGMTPTAFNGLVVAPQTLFYAMPIGDGVNIPTVALYRNRLTSADGTLLVEPGDAGIFSAGGCPLIVASRGDQLVFAHSGLNCVIDRTRVLTEDKERGREHESVVDSILRALGCEDRAQAAEVHAWVFWSIRPVDYPHPFDHPKHGQFNQKLLAYLTRCGYPSHPTQSAVCPDIPRIIERQFVDRGLPWGNVHLSDEAYLPLGAPTTRTGNGTTRSLIMVVRR